MFCYAYRVSYTYRVVTTFSLNAFCLLGIGVICMLTDGSLGAVLVGGVLVLLGANTSVMSASVFGLASILPQAYIKAASTGLGLSGFLPPVLKLVLLCFYTKDRIESVIIFLAVSAGISFLCVIAVLVRTQVVP